MSSTSDLPLRARVALWSSQLPNERGVYLGRRSTKIHVAIYRRSAGKVGGHLPGLPTARVLLLNHTGAKSGAKRTSPLMYHREGDIVAVAASKGGQPTHPSGFTTSTPTRTPRFRSVPRSATSTLASPPTKSGNAYGRSSSRSIRAATSSNATHKPARSRS
jgi:hypothetical protein